MASVKKGVLLLFVSFLVRPLWPSFLWPSFLRRTHNFLLIRYREVKLISASVYIKTHCAASPSNYHIIIVIPISQKSTKVLCFCKLSLFTLLWVSQLSIGQVMWLIWHVYCFDYFKCILFVFNNIHWVVSGRVKNEHVVYGEDCLISFLLLWSKIILYKLPRLIVVLNWKEISADPSAFENKAFSLGLPVIGMHLLASISVLFSAEYYKELHLKTLFCFSKSPALISYKKLNASYHTFHFWLLWYPDWLNEHFNSFY